MRIDFSITVLCTNYFIRILASDFDDTPVTFTLSPGDTQALVSIPILDGNVLERDERFDVALQLQGDGVAIGNPGQANVIITNDDCKLEENNCNLEAKQ